MNENLYDIQNGFSTDNKLSSVVHSWTGPGTSNTLPRVSSTLRRSTGITSDVIEDGSYLRVKTVSLSYNIGVPAHKTIKSLLLYVTGQNLVTLTHYSGFDPEINTGSTLGGIQTFGIDYFTYPKARTFLVSLNVTF